jgi:hypothetical protein
MKDKSSVCGVSYNTCLEQCLQVRKDAYKGYCMAADESKIQAREYINQLTASHVTLERMRSQKSMFVLIFMDTVIFAY